MEEGNDIDSTSHHQLRDQQPAYFPTTIGGAAPPWNQQRVHYPHQRLAGPPPSPGNDVSLLISQLNSRQTPEAAAGGRPSSGGVWEEQAEDDAPRGRTGSAARRRRTPGRRRGAEVRQNAHSLPS